MNAEQLRAAGYIAWRTWCGTTVQRVLLARDTPAGGIYVLLQASDGHDDGHDSLSPTARPATADEIAEFERVRAGRTAPIAYN